MKNIIKLEKQLVGKGEVSGYQFNRIAESENAYIYHVIGGNDHFEVIKRLNAPVCIDFEKRIYSETEFKEYYPKSRLFGFDAWTFDKLPDALKKFDEL